MRYRLLCLLSLMLMTTPSWASDTVASALAAYAWDKRQILLFTPSTEHPEYQRFMTAYTALREDFTDRKLHIWQIVPEQPVQLQTVVQPQLQSAEFQAQYQVSPETFRLILVGYDQAEKLRQSVVDIDAVLGTIDLMPMRQMEMLQEN